MKKPKPKKADDVIHSTQEKHQVYKQTYLGEFFAEIIETRQGNSSTGTTPTAIKTLVPMATHSFPVPPI